MLFCEILVPTNLKIDGKCIYILPVYIVACYYVAYVSDYSYITNSYYVNKIVYI